MNDIPISNNPLSSEKSLGQQVNQTKSTTVRDIAIGVTIASTGIIAGNKTGFFDTVMKQYVSNTNLIARKAELLESERILNELKQYPGASIFYDKKSKKWKVIRPIEKIQANGNTNIGKSSSSNDIKNKFLDVPRSMGVDPFNNINQSSNIVNPNEGGKNIPEVKNTNIVGTEEEYIQYLDSLPISVRLKIPTFDILIQEINLPSSGDMHLKIINNEMWIYGNIQVNEIGNKYRHRWATIDLESGRIDNSIFNRFTYMTLN